MKSCGVIVEYNPFHNGHQYHLEEARKISKAEIVVAVMSGNFLQRGEPAIYDKWIRTKEALLTGADLVIELPFAFAVQSADYFAQGAVSLLQALSVENLCFGTDQKENFDYEKFALFEQAHQREIEALFLSLKNNGMSYPQQMTEVYRKLYPEMPLDFSSPNHILGMSYAKENIKYAKPMKLHAIVREMSQYHDKEIESEKFASATAIRQAIHENKFDSIEKVVPKQTLTDIHQETSISWQNFWPFLKYTIETKSISELQSIYQMVEGIEYRLKEACSQAATFLEFVELVKTKRFTWTRIQRLCVYLLLNVRQVDIEAVKNQPYLRVLGMNEKGRGFLKERKKTCELPIISKIGKREEKLLSLDIKAGKVYRQGANQKNEQDFYRSPIILDNLKK